MTLKDILGKKFDTVSLTDHNEGKRHTGCSMIPGIVESAIVVLGDDEDFFFDAGTEVEFQPGYKNSITFKVGKNEYTMDFYLVTEANLRD